MTTTKLVIYTNFAAFLKELEKNIEKNANLTIVIGRNARDPETILYSVEKSNDTILYTSMYNGKHGNSNWISNFIVKRMKYGKCVVTFRVLKIPKNDIYMYIGALKENRIEITKLDADVVKEAMNTDENGANLEEVDDETYC